MLVCTFIIAILGSNQKAELLKLENEAIEYREEIDSLEKEISELEEDIKREKEINGNLKKENHELKEVKSVSRGNTSRTFQATAYCGCRKCNGKWTGYPTASGTDYVAGRTIAVDPNVIPLGSKVTVEGMGTFTAEDTGSAIKGNIIDIYFDSHNEALKFGRKNIKITNIERSE